MAANFVKKMFHKGHSSDDTADAGREDDERSTRFAEPDPLASPSGKKKQGKKEVRVQEPAEDGEQLKSKATSVKKSADKKGPPSVSFWGTLRN